MQQWLTLSNHRFKGLKFAPCFENHYEMQGLLQRDQNHEASDGKETRQGFISRGDRLWNGYPLGDPAILGHFA
jgi:hypothetical protein